MSTFEILVGLALAATTIGAGWLIRDFRASLAISVRIIAYLAFCVFPLIALSFWSGTAAFLSLMVTFAVVICAFLVHEAELRISEGYPVPRWWSVF